MMTGPWPGDTFSLAAMPTPTPLPVPTRASPLKLVGALALGALGIGLLIKALFFPTDPLTPEMVETMNRAPAARPSQ